MEDILGTIGKEESTNGDETKASKNNETDVNIFVKFGKLFKFGNEDKSKYRWKEFPWEETIIKNDVIKKWDCVDMKVVNQLHANFDTELGKFADE